MCGIALVFYCISIISKCEAVIPPIIAAAMPQLCQFLKSLIFSAVLNIAQTKQKLSNINKPIFRINKKSESLINPPIST